MVSSFEELTSEGCRLCPRTCGARRPDNEQGYCRAGALPRIAQAGPHHGEEPPLSGRSGSGTIFLTGCNLHCVFCQNNDISSRSIGAETSLVELAGTAVSLESMGCHNINFVTPSHHVDAVAGAVRLARESGLKVPVVYNCGGYESIESLDLLNGLVEIYMPDIKFFDPEACERYLNAKDYGRVVKETVKAMQTQVGDLKVVDGLAVSGLLIRHLVMPGYTQDSMDIMEFIHQEISPRAYVNVMAQYWPTSGAREFPSINRSPSMEEVGLVKAKARNLGLRLK